LIAQRIIAIYAEISIACKMKLKITNNPAANIINPPFDKTIVISCYYNVLREIIQAEIGKYK
jgi:hypothetical protein